MTENSAFTTPLACIICGVVPERAFAADVLSTQPYAATTFRSHGHYGSTVFDPSMISNEYLEINICDVCMQASAKRGAIWLRRPKPPMAANTDVSIWSPWGSDSPGYDEMGQ